MSDQVKYVLDEDRLPEAWYNIAADLPEPPPPVLHPGTGEPVGPDDLAPLFPMQIILQEVSTDRLIAIPEEVRSVYRQWRPTPDRRCHASSGSASATASPTTTAARIN